MTEMNENYNVESEEEITLSQKVKNAIIGGAIAVGGTAAVIAGKPVYEDWKAAKKEGITFRQKRLERKQKALKEANDKSRERLLKREMKLQDEIEREHRAHERVKQETQKPAENPDGNQAPDNATEPEKK